MIYTGVNDLLSVIHTEADDSINEYEIITRCISLSTIHTGADDSVNESEIITTCISLSIIYTGADDSINGSKSWLAVYH